MAAILREFVVEAIVEAGCLRKEEKEKTYVEESNHKTYLLIKHGEGCFFLC